MIDVERHRRTFGDHAQGYRLPLSEGSGKGTGPQTYRFTCVLRTGIRSKPFDKLVRACSVEYKHIPSYSPIRRVVRTAKIQPQVVLCIPLLGQRGHIEPKVAIALPTR